MDQNFLYKSYLSLLFILPLSFIVGSGPWNINYVLLSIISLIILVIKRKSLILTVGKLYFFFLTFLIFSLYLIFISVISEFTEEIISRSIVYMRFFIIVLAIPFVLKIEDNAFEKLTKFFFIILLFCILIVCISSLAEFLRLDVPIYTKSTVNYRLNGPFGDEAIVGLYLFTFLPGFLFISKVLNRNKLMTSTITLLSIFLILASGERMVIIMTVGFFILYLILRTNNLKKILISFSILVSFFTLMLILIFNYNLDKNYTKENNKENFDELRNLKIIKNNLLNFGSNIDQENHYKKQSYIFRINQTLKEFKDPFNTSYFLHFKVAVTILNDNKMLGTGFRSFRYECTNEKYNEINLSVDERCRTHPHNIHLEILSDSGLVGYFIFITMMIIFLINHLKFSYSKKNILLFIPLLLFLFPFRTSMSFFASIYGGLFWYQIILILVYNKNSLRKLIK